jgi:hypothetical protein
MSAAITIRRALLSPLLSARSRCPLLTYARSLSKRPRYAEKDLFTPSPFAKSNTIPINDELVAHRQLMEENAYGMRRYLLLPRNELDLYDPPTLLLNGQVLASIYANQNTMFGLKQLMHNNTQQFSSSAPAAATDNTNVNFANHLNICGPLLDIAKEDASINGQQPQALCALNGLCGWVKECLENNGKRSKVLDVLTTEYSESNDINNEENSAGTEDSSKETKKAVEKPRSRQRIQNKSNSYTVPS